MIASSITTVGAFCVVARSGAGRVFRARNGRWVLQSNPEPAAGRAERHDAGRAAVAGQGGAWPQPGAAPARLLSGACGRPYDLAGVRSIAPGLTVFTQFRRCASSAAAVRAVSRRVALGAVHT